MKITYFHLARWSLPVAGFLSVLSIFAFVAVALGANLIQVSSDPYTNTTSQHATQVEPDTFSYGSTIVMAVQTGRFYDGGASNIAFSTSTNSGASWVSGFLPGITKFASGPYDRVSDPAVAYDARHGVWLISTLPLYDTPSIVGAGVLTSRSTDGGLTWGNPVMTVPIGGNVIDVDKNWIVCDNTATSPFYGHCYTQFDDPGNGNRLYMSTSTDGGLTWGAALATANNAGGIGGQPVVLPNGTVIVPANNANQSSIISFRSTNGGASWENTVTVTPVSDHRVAGRLRTSPLPSAEVDGAGKVYVVWQDCRFRRGCKSNDIVMSTSTDGLSWTAPARIPIDAVTSKVDHFIPGLAVNPSTSGATASLALTYYYYPVSTCSTSKCSLNIGYISSNDSGASWSAPAQLNSTTMKLSWLPDTSQGYMVGDYISASFVGGSVSPGFVLASSPSGSTFNIALYSATGLSAASNAAVQAKDTPVPNAASDHTAPQVPVKIR